MMMDRRSKLLETLSNIMKKMGVQSRSAASELGIRLGLVSPPRDE